MLGLTAIFLVASGLAYAFETEPNNTCATAQEVGAWAPTFEIAGEIAAVADETDVDFFRFEGTPGTKLRVVLRGEPSDSGALDDLWLGRYGSDCALDGEDDDDDGREPHLTFDVPADGVFIVAAACCDAAFNGDAEGTYTLIVEEPTEVESIHGVVTDAVTRDPLVADVSLFQCSSETACDDDAFAKQTTDDDGMYTFDATTVAESLDPGWYRVRATVTNYDEGMVTFDVEAGDQREANLELTRPRIVRVTGNPEKPAFTCGRLGRMCRVRVKIRNHSNVPFRGLAWTIVEVQGITFEASRRRVVNMKPLEERRIGFFFRVPKSVADSVEMKATFRVGQRPTAYFNKIFEDTFTYEPDDDSPE